MQVMEYKGFKASIMKANRLTGDYVHGLPPGTPINIFPVDVFKSPLSHWITGPGNYVVPVQSDWGLWFKWTDNDYLNTAILPTVKGMNPVTGRRTNGYALERYEKKCPTHGTDFKDGLFCEKCNYKWPNQNYIAYPNTLWWDGFRTGDGKVRQFFFTEDLAKSIPEKVIGKEDTVPAFGFAFYKPKVFRNPPKTRTSRGISSNGFFKSDSTGFYNYTNDWFVTADHSEADITWNNSKISHTYFSNTSSDLIAENCSDSALTCSATPDSLDVKTNGSTGLGGPSPNKKLSLRSASVRHNSNYVEPKAFTSQKIVKKNAEVGVGAGAEIAQDLVIDPLNLSDWNEKPEAVMRLYFVFVEQFEEIKSKGLKDLVGEKEGYLSGLPVG